jgi:hypothetical protein
MSRITIHAGDFATGKGSISSSTIIFPWAAGDGFSSGKCVSMVGNLESTQLASEDSVKRVGGTVGWGIAGAALLGPVGLLAGLLMGGKGKDVTFIAILKDGKKFLATVDSSSFIKLQALVF